jgi:hypothetical protein
LTNQITKVVSLCIVVGSVYATASTVLPRVTHETPPALTSEDTRKHTESYQSWLAANGLGRVITAREITTSSEFREGQANQTFTLHLTLNGSRTVPQDIAHSFWTALRDQFTRSQGADIEQRLLMRFAHELNVSAARTSIKLTRYASDQCWVVTLAVAEKGYETHEHLCTSVTAVTSLKPETLAPLVKQVGESTIAPAHVVTISPVMKMALPAPSRNGCQVLGVSATVEERTSGLLLSLESRLHRHYQSARYQLVSDNGSLREVTVDRMKNQVLTNRWERLQLSFVAAPITKDNTQVVLIVDGQYAPGIGSAPPPVESYRDMEPQYTRELTTYTKTLLRELTRK